MAASILGTAGLSLDILGVGILLFCTSISKIEAELTYKVVRAFTDEGGEWSQPYSFEEHLERLERSRTRVTKNRRRGWYGLVLVIVGFVLQGVAIWL